MPKMRCWFNMVLSRISRIRPPPRFVFKFIKSQRISIKNEGNEGNAGSKAKRPINSLPSFLYNIINEGNAGSKNMRRIR